MAENIALARLVDLKVDSFFTAGRLNNRTGGKWEKFSTNGQDKVTTGATFPITKLGDVLVTDMAEHRKLFDRTQAGEAYVTAMDKHAPANEVIGAKRQSDMLASMLQAFGLRYGSRLRHTCAVMSRRASIAKVDGDLLTMEMNR